jgi:DGQHR domain-containing protein
MRSGDVIRVECIRVQQEGLEFYAFVMHSRILREIAYVSRRDQDNPLGYQRYISEKRLKEVGEYIKKPKATFPNSIIVNLDPTKVRFEPSASGDRGTMIIPKSTGVAWIIDGQHRLYGFERSDGKEFDLLVAAFLGLTPRDQATIFKVINSTQKGVSPSLIYDLIDLTKDAEYLDQRAHEIVKALNTDDDSPWKEQIKMLGVGRGMISQAAFVVELKKLLQDTIFKEYDASDQIKLLKDYFKAVKELFPEAWLSKKHVLCKTLGVAAILMTMRKVLIHCRLKNSFTKDTMKSVLENIKEIEIPTEHGVEKLDFSGRQLGAFGGRKGQRRLFELLESALPPIRP